MDIIIIYYAYNKAGKSDKSPILKLLYDSVLSSPFNLLLTWESSTNIEISWSFTDTNNEGSNIQITGFNIYNNNILLKSDLLSNDTLTYNISNSIVGIIYVFILTAKNEIGESSHSYFLQFYLYNDINQTNQINKQNLNIEVNDSSNQNNEIISNDEELNFNINTTSNKDNIFK